MYEEVVFLDFGFSVAILVMQRVGIFYNTDFLGLRLFAHFSLATFTRAFHRLYLQFSHTFTGDVFPHFSPGTCFPHFPALSTNEVFPLFLPVTYAPVFVTTVTYFPRFSLVTCFPALLWDTVYVRPILYYVLKTV